MLLIALLQSTVVAAVGSPEQSQTAPVVAGSSADRAALESDSNGIEVGTIVHASANGTAQAEFGDGRTGFWIVGILVNLSVLGWFLAWALKEWRKKKDD